jgi:hypothetical protein
MLDGRLYRELASFTPGDLYQDTVIARDESSTVGEVLLSVFAARLSVAYHAGVSFLMLFQYKDAVSVLVDCATCFLRKWKHRHREKS